MPRLVRTLSWQRWKKEKKKLSRKSWKKRELRKSRAARCTVFKDISPSSTPAHSNNFTEAVFAPNYTVCKLNCLHNGTFVMALIYLSYSASFFSGPRRKSFLVSVLPCFSPFFVTAIISWNLTPGILFLFNFPFSRAQAFPPPMSTTPYCTAQCAKNISVPRNNLKSTFNLICHSSEGQKERVLLFHKNTKLVTVGFQPAFVLHLCQSVYLLLWECVFEYLFLDRQQEFNRLPRSLWQPSHDFVFPKDNIHCNGEEESR